MKSGWVAEQRDLGGLGLAGICRETSRVVLRVVLPNFHNFALPLLSVTALFLTYAFACSRNVARGLEAGTSLLRLIGDWVFSFSLQIFALEILLLCTPIFVFRVASLYCTDGNLRAAPERLPVAPLKRLVFTFHLVVLPFLVAFTSLSVTAMLLLEDEIMLPVLLLVWASAAYAAVVCQMACVISVLEDAVLFDAVRRSRELLAGKFCTVATLLLTLDGCIITLLVSYPGLVVDDGPVVGIGFLLAMAVALWAVLVVVLVAQPVIYMVCKSHHQEVVDLVQLHAST